MYAKAFLSMSKPRILTLVVVMTALGYYLGLREINSHAPFLSMTLLFVTIGTAMTGAGAAILNHFLERDDDGLMSRTRERALVRGILSPGQALGIGVLCVLGGTALLTLKVNLLTAFLALLTAFLYALVYTPLKKITWLNTTIGAIPGALPPMGGWAAATGHLELGAWVLFLILFVWQHPHFYAIAWMYREDYTRAGFKMLPVVDPSGDSTFRHILLHSLVLIPVSLVPSLIGMSSWVYFIGALAFGLAFLGSGERLYRSRSNEDARRVLRASVVYLPALCILIVGDAVIRSL